MTVESTSARELGWARTAALTGAPSARVGSVGLGGWATGEKQILPEPGGQSAREGERKFSGRLPSYFLILVKVIRNDQRSYFDLLLIFLAKRFNTAYYLLLNTGDWSGGETSGWLTFVKVWWKRAKLSDSQVPAAAVHCYRALRSLFHFGSNFPLHVVDATEKILPASLRGASVD